MNSSKGQRPIIAALLATTMIAGLSAVPAMAQNAAPAAPAAAPIAASTANTPEGTIRSITVTGTQRLEQDTVMSYTKLRVGQAFSQESLDQALRDLYETELFADVQIRNDGGALTVEVKENPVINRIVLEGNKRLKDDKIRPEIKLAPRQIYTRSKVRADVARIVELYRRQGRFAATIEPKMVQLDQNRVDIVFEISEGPKSKVRQINIIGNEKFKDGELRGQMVTKQSRWFRIFSSGTSYDPDRLAYDQQKLRQFYLTEGYADFRVISAVAELTPDKQDFIITYVVEEGDRYKFGDVKVESDIRDLSGDALTRRLPMKKGDWYNAKQVEDTVDTLSETAGLFGYAFAQVEPDFNRSKDDLTMGINFRIANAPRVYVERVDINGNTLTQDKVVRREFRLAEGDAFNSFLVKRSKDRINSLGFFQEKLDIEQKPGSAPDRIVLETNVQEKSTGELSLSAGYSSLERFIISASITQRNFRGKGQELRTSVNYSAYSKSVEVGFTEPYFMDKNIALGGDIYRRDLNSFRYLSNNDRDTTYEQTTTGFQLRAGVPITEYVSLALRYTLNFDDVTLDKDTYYTDGVCDPLLAGRYLCDAIGKRTTSSIGYSLIYDTRDNRIRPTRGQTVTLSQDFAGLGGDVRYIRTRANAAKYWGLGGGFIFSLTGEGGYIHSLQGTRYDATGAEVDPIRLTDRFFLGEPQMRGFDIRGVGPRVKRYYLVSQTNDDGSTSYVRQTGNNNVSDDALGGRVYYMARAEMEIPLGSGAREMGLRPSIFADVGAVAGLKNPGTINFAGYCSDSTGSLSTVRATGTAASPVCPVGYDTKSGMFEEDYLGDTLKPRLSVGFGVNWNSPFGPFRIDIAKALLKEPGDDNKLITFNVGTQF
ncbi:MULTISPECIES: outer membrane protein assembly factor BamA [Sphingobium]|jgi:outer membrane protein insertion porin family|nr:MULTISPECIES: outer membrane protein assembly factor BamA [Sphingobium]MBR2268447.1 outer membrane protein assembly factor BamA [Sphingobium sp.]MBT2244684.1 outer membrane protein assembly factor BamA [Sphingobium sp. BHU LFT2]MDH2130279.1 outer membrane protein assembly factor BamA [Sphingobium yanoikuyae]MDH2150623.1 outer membrane protein assembly factor BamA [Sphingobium yanoikuyae]MDH2165977.1 outer membrane protein assembly factor BamA [Sphingobium yanoikuyae]